MTRKIVLQNVTGFRVKDVNEPILIRDTRGLIFYDTEPLVPKVKYFNLPAGTFFVERGSFREAFTPRYYPLSKLPPPQRYQTDPLTFKIEFGHNPNKCSIIWDEKRILFDSSFLERPEPEVFFILYHEYGHAFYEAEHLADLYAANMMKKKGFNPSQICYAHLDSLSPQQIDRKEFINQKLIESL